MRTQGHIAQMPGWLRELILARQWKQQTGLLVFAGTALLFVSWVSWRFGLNHPPATSGDEPSYDSMAWELSSGGGFATDYRKPDFRELYDRAAQTNPDLYTLPKTTAGTIAYRPPLYSVVMAATNLLLGRQLWGIRLIDILAMSATAGLLAHYLRRNFGLHTSLAGVVLFVAVDTRTRLYARAILTEALACLLLTLLTLTLLRLAKTYRTRDVILAGFLAGLSVLTRSVVILWLPGLAVLLYVIFRRAHDLPLRRALSSVALFSAVTVGVISPWAVRNTMVLGSFKPMGTQGLMELSAGYSDVAWEHRGVWQNLGQHGFFEDVTTRELTELEREVATAEFSRSRAMTWIRGNLWKLPVLAAMKLYHEFRPYTAPEAFILIMAVLGAIVHFPTRDGKILLAMILINASAIAVTWSVLGRFLVPQLFIIHVFSAIGLSRLIRILPRTPDEIPEHIPEAVGAPDA